MTHIHETALVDTKAQLDDSVTVGPYCVVGADVTLGANVTLITHAVVEGLTTIGERTTIYPFASIGHRPQDLKYKGEPSTLVIGCNNTIREYVTMNPGTEGGGMVTKVGANSLFMMGSHVAHDCQLGDGIIMANNATLAGHVEVGDYAILGGLSAVHQFVRVGRYAMIGGMSGVEGDVIPYGSVMGNRAILSGLNIIGLKRHGFPRDDIHDLRTAYRLLFAQEGTLCERVEDVAETYKDSDPVMEIVSFIRCDSSRAVIQPEIEHAA